VTATNSLPGLSVCIELHGLRIMFMWNSPLRSLIVHRTEG